jgi:hypothetical protein
MRPTPSILCPAAGCAAQSRSAPVPPEVAELAGCYAMEYGAWGPEIDEIMPSSPPDLPAAIRLRAAAWRDRPDPETRWYHVNALPAAPSGPYPFQVWSLVGGDSVWAGMPVSFGGFELHLRREGADLRGEVEASTDMINLPAPFATHRGHRPPHPLPLVVAHALPPEPAPDEASRPGPRRGPGRLG